MKILFIISVKGHGSGGHFHSLNHISREIGKTNDIKIVSIGPGFSRIISENPYFEKHIVFNGYNFFSVVKNFRGIIKNFRPDIFHTFDSSCYNVIRILINSKRNKILLNKCGGPNPLDFPFVKNLILFSSENYEWFKANNKFSETAIHLIPNRVRALKLSSNYQPILKNSNHFNFIRICRIGNSYNKSITDSVNLIEYLYKEGYLNVRLFIIGVVENNDVFTTLLNSEIVKKGFVTILNNPEYCLEASKMLYLADAVIGTGRGFMEASSLGKPLLAINSNDIYPAIIDENSFFDAFKTNFSERNSFQDFSGEVNLTKIKMLINNPTYYNRIASLSLEYFNKYFNIESTSELYLKVYNQAQYAKRKIAKDMLLIIRDLYHFFTIK